MLLFDEKLLFDFAARHAEQTSPLARWSRVIRAANCDSFNDLRSLFPSADYVRPYTVFNVAGNKIRIIASVDFESHTVVIRQVLTHAEYDKWTRRYRKGRG